MPKFDSTKKQADLGKELRRLFAKAKLPTNPALATEILRLCDDSEAGAQDFSRLIRSDPALTIRLLKTANSVEFAQRTRVTTIERAVTVLGLKRVKTAALGFQLVSHLNSLGGVPFDIKAFWQHSVLRACVARSIAQTLIPQRQEEAFLIGLLEECGTLLMVQVLGASYASLCRSKLSPPAFHLVERESFPYSHVDAISAMAGEWNLPETIAIPLVRHHLPPTQTLSELDQLSAVAYFVGNLCFDANDSSVPPEDEGVRSSLFAALRFDESAWSLAQRRATDAYKQTCTLFGSILPEEVEVGDLLNAANSQLAAVASDSQQRVVDVEAERMAILQEQKQLQHALKEYRERIALDPLTNALNRGGLMEVVREGIEQHLDRGVPIGVLFLDLDNFKRLNDTHGHAAGDKTLKALTALLEAEIEHCGPVGRYGGEEFVILLRGLPQESVRNIAEQIVLRVRLLDSTALGFPGNVTCSLGAVWSDRLPVRSAEELLSIADQLMYKAKRAGKDRCCFEVLQASNPEASGECGAHTSESSHRTGPPLSARFEDQASSIANMQLLARQLNDNDANDFAGIRKQERKRIVGPCVLHYFPERGTELRSEPAVTRNMSTGGMGLLVHRPMLRGEPVEVVLDRPTSKLFLAGLVSYCRHVDGGVHDVGIQFVSHSVTPIISALDPAATRLDWVAQALAAKTECNLEPQFSG
ncbi:MAG: HDOD domain-containing protein [Planctomycetes bacterium]|nr:HDOD domain-containing protein [Planctomycetota bacterium]